VPPSRPLEDPHGSGLENDRIEDKIGVLDLERQLPAQAEAIEGYHAKAVELINANVNVTLDYVWRLAEVRSPAEFIALSTKQACRLFELIMTHATTFGVFSQSLNAAPNGRDAKDP
jgi:Phasin protein